MSNSIRTDATLSVLVPVYNEEGTVANVLERVLALGSILREVVVVDDGSSDGTAGIVESLARRDPRIRFFRQPVNQGKTAAIRRALAEAIGEVIIIQDADLEYDPADYLPMLDALNDGRGDIVYGSRYLKRPDRGWLANLAAGRHPSQGWGAYLGGQSLSVVCRLFTGRYLTDTVTALKLFPRTLLPRLDLRTSGFELDHEITAKVLARGCRIAEVPVRYFPRSREEGKKIGARDWFRAVRTFARFRNG